MYYIIFFTHKTLKKPTVAALRAYLFYSEKRTYYILGTMSAPNTYHFQLLIVGGCKHKKPLAYARDFNAILQN